ncbi:MAG: hypothetical protein ACKERG_03340 [Candidatus Hodgkinia cicadicola]
MQSGRWTFRPTTRFNWLEICAVSSVHLGSWGGVRGQGEGRGTSGREWRVSEIIQCVILCTRDTTAKLHVSAFALHRLQHCQWH